MRTLFILLAVILMGARGFAQTASNSDFNPFPQMEQDATSNTDSAQNQENDGWPPANSDSQTNTGGGYD